MQSNTPAPTAHFTAPVGWELATIQYCTPAPCLRDLDDGVAGEFLFFIREGMGDFETVVRGAVRGWRASVRWSEDFAPNWGDAIECIPPGHWFEHGLIPVSLTARHQFLVDHDETFP